MIKLDHYCDGEIPGGFFSKLGIVLDWVHNCMYENENIYINWNCNETLDYNLWDTLFEQPLITSNESKNRDLTLFHYRYYHTEHIYNGIHDIIPSYYRYNYGQFWNRSDIFFDNSFQNIRNEFNKAWTKIKIKSHVNERLEQYLNSFGEKTLGVTVRIPGHFTGDLPNTDPIEYYKKISNEIEKEFHLNGYDKIFVACDIQYFIDLMIEKFGEDKIIFTKYNRINSLLHDWVEKKIPLNEEYFNILVDALLLTKCNLLMGGSSNIFVGCLFINNELPYKVFDITSSESGL